MAQLTLTVGTTNISVPIRLDNQQLRAVIRRYAIAKSISLEGKTETEVAQAVLRSLLKYASDVAMDGHRVQLEATARATIEGQLKAENELTDL